MSEVEGKNKKEIAVKSERVLRKWLDMAPRYRDPARSPQAIAMGAAASKGE